MSTMADLGRGMVGPEDEARVSQKGIRTGAAPLFDMCIASADSRYPAS